MGTLTLDELRAEVTSNLGERDDVTDARLNRALELAQTRIVRRHDWEELMLTETKTLTYSGTIATDRFLAFSDLTQSEPKELFSIRFLDGSRSRKLIKVTPRTIDKYIPNPEGDSTGIPSVYIIWADKFEWWRVPDQAYTAEFRMSTWPTTFIGASDGVTSDLNRKDELIITLTTSYLYHQLGEYERAKNAYGIFIGLLNEAINEDQVAPDTDIKPNFEMDVIGRSNLVDDPFVRRTV